jgi:hypothetical protein
MDGPTWKQYCIYFSLSAQISYDPSPSQVRQHASDSVPANTLCRLDRIDMLPVPPSPPPNAQLRAIEIPS